MNILRDILSHKRLEVERQKQKVPLRDLERSAAMQRPRHSLREALSAIRPAVIAEIKKASPSRGIIRQNFDPVALAKEFVDNGAAALSILTDEHFFQGSLEYLKAVRSITEKPLLRKDFIVDVYQIIEAKQAGADAILLIAAALESTQLQEFLKAAQTYDLEALVEIHSEQELNRLDFSHVKLLGINNRDLRTFEVRLETSIEIVERVPSTTLCVSESGIRTADDILRLASYGIHAFLIGESLMQHKNPGDALAALLAASTMENR